MSYKAHRSPPFMIDGTHWFWSGTHYFSWSESQGPTSGKLQQITAFDGVFLRAQSGNHQLGMLPCLHWFYVFDKEDYMPHC